MTASRSRGPRSISRPRCQAARPDGRCMAMITSLARSPRGEFVVRNERSECRQTDRRDPIVQLCGPPLQELSVIRRRLGATLGSPRDTFNRAREITTWRPVIDTLKLPANHKLQATSSRRSFRQFRCACEEGLGLKFIGLAQIALARVPALPDRAKTAISAHYLVSHTMRFRVGPSGGTRSLLLPERALRDERPPALSGSSRTALKPAAPNAKLDTLTLDRPIQPAGSVDTDLLPSRALLSDRRRHGIGGCGAGVQGMATRVAIKNPGKFGCTSRSLQNGPTDSMQIDDARRSHGRCRRCLTSADPNRPGLPLEFPRPGGGKKFDRRVAPLRFRTL